MRAKDLALDLEAALRSFDGLGSLKGIRDAWIDRLETRDVVELVGEAREQLIAVLKADRRIDERAAILCGAVNGIGGDR